MASESEHREDEDAEAQVAPIVKLDEVAVTTGEEDDDPILDLYEHFYYEILVHATITVQEHSGDDKSCVWHASDFADGDLKDELFCIRFPSVENCKTFMTAMQEVAESQGKKAENKDASDTAGLLEKLSVAEHKDKTGEKELEKVTLTDKEGKQAVGRLEKP